MSSNATACLLIARIFGEVAFIAETFLNVMQLSTWSVHTPSLLADHVNIILTLETTIVSDR